jgi:preprotein translocase subunit SecE
MANEVAEKKPSTAQSIIVPVREYLVDTLAELRKVHWPSRENVRNLTIIVLAVTLGMAAILGLFDYLFENLFAGLIKASPDPVAIAVGVVIVLAIIVLVLFSSRERNG